MCGLQKCRPPFIEVQIERIQSAQKVDFFKCESQR